MSGGYTPLFGSMFKGSMAGRWPDTGIWCALLAMADRNGEIDCTPEYISLVTGCPVADVEAVIARLCAPDPKSRSQIEEGRRLRPIPNRGFGWVVVNHGRYREKARLMTRDAERTATGADAERKRASRDKSPDVPRCPPPSPSPDADLDADEEPEMLVLIPPLDSSDTCSGGAARQKPNGKPRKPINGRPRPSRRMPPDHPVDIEQLRAAVPDLPRDMDVAAEVAKLRDHEFRDTHTDWDATTRNWVRRAVSRGDYSRVRQIRWE